VQVFVPLRNRVIILLRFQPFIVETAPAFVTYLLGTKPTANSATLNNNSGKFAGLMKSVQSAFPTQNEPLTQNHSPRQVYSQRPPDYSRDYRRRANPG
jgi:hypothetical protein